MPNCESLNFGPWNETKLPLFMGSRVIKSIHPASIVNQLPRLVNKRISNLSCEKKTFNNAKLICESALKQSEYKSTIKFDPRLSTKRNSKRKMIWFKPLLTQNVTTNIQKLLFRLVRKNFPKNLDFEKY